MGYKDPWDVVADLHEGRDTTRSEPIEIEWLYYVEVESANRNEVDDET